MSAPRGPSTTALHADRGHNSTRAVGSAIFQSTTFRWDDVDDGARLAAQRHPPEFYTRLGNPNVAQLEALLAALEGGEAALAYGLGRGGGDAQRAAFLSAGDHVVGARVLYGETHALLTTILPRFGVRTTLVDSTDTESFARAITPATKMIVAETPANPTLELLDLRALAALARDHKARLVVDNTFATPFNTQPLLLGAHTVFHSASKYLAGHSDVIAGALVSDADTIAQAFAHLRVFGATLGPFDAWLVVRGLRTFALRMARHNENGARVAAFLREHPAVAEVRYPGDPAHPAHALARTQMRGFGAMMSLRLKGGDAAARGFLRALELCTLAASLGSVESLIQYPAVLSNIAPEARLALGIPADLIRFSVGCEDAEDLLADLAQALEKSAG